MTSSRLPTILIALAVLLLLVYSSVFVVNAREQAIVLRFGQIRAVSGTGKIAVEFLQIHTSARQR